MGTIKQYNSQANVPSTAGTTFAPNSLAQQSFAGAKALGVMGDVATGLGKEFQRRNEEQNRQNEINKKIQDEMDRRQRKFIDAKNSIQAENIFKVAQLKTDAHIESTPDTSTWIKTGQKNLQSAYTEIGKLDISPEEKAILQEKLNMQANMYLYGVQSQSVKRDAQDAENAVSVKLQSAIAGGNPVDIEESKQQYFDVMSAIKDPAEVNSIYDGLVEKGQVELKINTLDTLRNNAALNPEAMSMKLQQEIDNRKNGKGEISPELVSNQDLEATIDYARSVGVSKEAAIKKELEAKIESERKIVDDSFIKPQEQFLADVPNILSNINSSTVFTTKDKEEQRDKVNNRVNAIKAGKIDPVTEFDPKAYNDMSIRISRNSKSITQTEISNMVGKGKDGGITVEQGEVLTNLKRKYDGADVLGNSLHSIYSGTIGGLQSAKAFGKTKEENVEAATKMRTLLNSWTIKNPNATEQEYQQFFDSIMDTSGYSAKWDRFWFGLSREGKFNAINQNIKEMGSELQDNSRIEVVSPTGEIFTLPKSQLQEAIREGYKER